jgi:hypothetical protein
MHRRYLVYIARHKWFVLLAGLRVSVPLWRLLVHDWSKFSPAEWLPYARYFYGYERGKQPPVAKSAFDRAWLHHQHLNPHHHQHWVLREDSGATKALPMPEHYVREMVADWMGAGRAITGRWEVHSWYAKNAEKMVLHPGTRQRVALLLARVEEAD